MADETDGAFERDTDYITDRILDDPDARWPVEAGRYRLAAAAACPWANRTTIVRRLLGLEDALSLAFAGPTHDWTSWQFDLDEGRVDPVLGIPRLRDAYLARFPDYPKGITVPAIVDVPSGQVATNDFAQMTLDFSSQWTAHHRAGAPDLYPDEHRDEIDELIAVIYTDVNNGVYRTGFSSSQAAYEDAYRTLFARLDELEERLTTRRFLVGDTITEVDVRLFTTLIRFDAVYHGHFKCNRNKLSEMPALWGYVRDLYQTPGFGDQVHFDQIKEHYYGVHTTINPTRVVPVGPDLRGLLTPHHREELGGRPFGDGTAPERIEPHGGFGAPPDGMTPPVLTDTLTERIGLS
ncbi:MAG: glutathione S-transferase C-terminal domain-containing protein [Actinomycetota bacterium]